MKFYHALSWLTIASLPLLNLNAQINAKEIQKNFVHVTDSLYPNKFETSNGEYKQFLNFLAATDSASYRRYSPDSTAWLQVDLNATPLSRYYHRHPAYNKFPVVGISYEAAIAYCNWLSESYNRDGKRQFKKVKFVLPSEAEWTKAAEGGRSQALYPWGNYYLRNKDREPLCNFRQVSDVSIYRDASGKPQVHIDALQTATTSVVFYTSAVKSFYPNDFGLYNICGNVAEMTSEKGLTKGGSWNSYGGEVNIPSKKYYDAPSAEVGFRVFMKIIER